MAIRAQTARRAARDSRGGIRPPAATACPRAGRFGRHGALAGGNHQAAVAGLDHRARRRVGLFGGHNRERTKNEPHGRAVRAVPERVRLRPGLHRANVVLDRRGRSRPVDQAVGLSSAAGPCWPARHLAAAAGRGPPRASRSPRTSAGRPPRPAALPVPRRSRRARWPRGPARSRGRRRSAGVMWITVTPVSVSPW